MRNKYLALLTWLLIAALVLVACRPSQPAAQAPAAEPTATPAPAEPTATPEQAAAEPTATAATAVTPTQEAAAPAAGGPTLTIWADEVRAPVLETLTQGFTDQYGVDVSVVQKGFNDLRNDYKVAAPSGGGPDILLGANDWIGELNASGLLAEVSLGDKTALFAPNAVEAFTYTDGKLYGLPYAVENVALFRNTDLVPEAPATFEDLSATALSLKEAGTVDVPLAVQQDPANPYHNEPMFTAAGGYIFAQNPDGSYNPDDLGIDSEGGLKAATLFNEWATSGLISGDVSYDVMIDSFATGKAPFAITGPWAISGMLEKNADLPYVVEAIPPVAGGDTRPFVGVQGFMVSAFSDNQALATTFLLDYVNTPEVAMALFEAQPRPPALTSVYEEVSTDPDIQGFGAAGANGQPLPNIPEMSAVWESFEAGYVNAFNAADAAGAEKAFTDAATEIRNKIAAG
jgi:maltose-binding protein MalE